MSQSNPAFFFSATQSVDNRLGDVFSFTWGSYAGLRELWWQVRGFHSQFPALHINDVKNKFLSGLPIPGGIDFKHLFLDSEWEVHEKEFSKWLIFEACTLYEGWAEKICRDIFPAPDQERFAKAIQFPRKVKPNGTITGYPLAVTSANNTRSALMHSEIFPVLKASKLNCWAHIDNYLIAYRYFKECRNSFIHSDGFATQEVIDTFNALQLVQGLTPSPFRHPFILPNQKIGEKIVLDLRDSTLFATLVRKLICTFDAALSVSIASENLLEQRIRALIATKAKWQSLPGNGAARVSRIERILSSARIPKPVNFGNMMTWMQSKGLV